MGILGGLGYALGSGVDTAQTMTLKMFQDQIEKERQEALIRLKADLDLQNKQKESDISLDADKTKRAQVEQEKEDSAKKSLEEAKRIAGANRISQARQLYGGDEYKNDPNVIKALDDAQDELTKNAVPSASERLQADVNLGRDKSATLLTDERDKQKVIAAERRNAIDERKLDVMEERNQNWKDAQDNKLAALIGGRGGKSDDQKEKLDKSYHDTFEKWMNAHFTTKDSMTMKQVPDTEVTNKLSVLVDRYSDAIGVKNATLLAKEFALKTGKETIRGAKIDDLERLIDSFAANELKPKKDTGIINKPAAATQNTEVKKDAPDVETPNPTEQPKQKFNDAGYSTLDSTIAGAKRGDSKARSFIQKMLDEGDLSSDDRMKALDSTISWARSGDAKARDLLQRMLDEGGLSGSERTKIQSVLR